MKTENLDDYELFYVELPPADYLNDIEIQDEYDQTDYDHLQGLSEEQLQDIAGDLLGIAKDALKASAPELSLFPGDQAAS